jgi:hypothetical protein
MLPAIRGGGAHWESMTLGIRVTELQFKSFPKGLSVLDNRMTFWITVFL